MIAFVRPVPDELADGQLSFLERQPVDVDVARAQHAAYCDLLSSLGAEVVALPAAPGYPDSVFVEDAFVVVEDLAILTRSGAPTRRGETAGLRPELERHGLRVADITEPATLDGGDVLQIGRTVYVGTTLRTNAAAHAQLAALVAPLGRDVVPVTVTGCLHLKSGVTALPDGTLVCIPDWLDVSAFGDRLRLAAPEPSGADVLLLDDTVVLLASAPRTAELIASRGHVVRTVDLSEFEKLEAGPTCPSVIVARS